MTGIEIIAGRIRAIIYQAAEKEGEEEGGEPFALVLENTIPPSVKNFPTDYTLAQVKNEMSDYCIDCLPDEISKIKRSRKKIHREAAKRAQVILDKIVKCIDVELYDEGERILEN